MELHLTLTQPSSSSSSSKNLKGLQIIGKGGEIACPIPSRNAVHSLIETEEKIGDGGETVQRHLPAGPIALVELRLSMMELLEVAIEVGR